MRLVFATRANLDSDHDTPRISAAVDASVYVDQKMSALAAHATQISTDGPFFALSNNLGNVAWGTEFYRLVKGRQGPLADNGLEDDLFAGVG